MAVIHILKDGSRVPDIRDHVVRVVDMEPLYRFIHSINQKSGKTLDLHNGNEVQV